MHKASHLSGGAKVYLRGLATKFSEFTLFSSKLVLSGRAKSHMVSNPPNKAASPTLRLFLDIRVLFLGRMIHLQWSVT